MAFSKDEIMKDLNDEQEIFSVVDKKRANGQLYYRVVGDQGTELTYKAETFGAQLDEGKIEFVDEDETEFTIERTQNFNLWS